MIVTTFQLLSRYWPLIVATTVLSSLLSVVAVFLMTPVYRGEVLVMYSAADQSNETLALLSRQFGGLGSLAGIGGETAQARAEAIATLESRQLSTRFIEQNNLMPHLFPDRWNDETGEWIELDSVPTMADAFERFDEDVRRVNIDATNGLISVAIQSPQRTLVADWTNDLVKAVNERLRERAMEEAQQNVTFLQDQLMQTTILEVKQSIYQLIEAQISKAALANTRADYAFRVIDPAVEPEVDEFVRPKRILIVALGLAFGIVLGFLIALVRESFREFRMTGAREAQDE